MQHESSERPKESAVWKVFATRIPSLSQTQALPGFNSKPALRGTITSSDQHLPNQNNAVVVNDVNFCLHSQNVRTEDLQRLNAKSIRISKVANEIFSSLLVQEESVERLLSDGQMRSKTYEQTLTQLIALGANDQSRSQICVYLFLLSLSAAAVLLVIFYFKVVEA